MAAAIGAVELSAVAVLWLVVGMLVLANVLVLGPIRILHSSLGWVPVVGGLIGKVERYVTAGLDAARRGTEGAAVTMWHGVIWSFDESLGGLEYFSGRVLDGLRYARATVLPRFVHTVTWPIEQALAGAVSRVASLERELPRDIARVEVDARHYADTALQTARGDIAALHTTVTREMTVLLDRAEAQLRREIGRAETSAETAGAHAIDVLRTAEAAAIGQAERVGELALDDLRKLAGGLDWRTIATLIASIPVLNALVQALEAETGLGRAECRAKVKQICGTDPARWARLLALMALPVEWPGLVELIRWLETLTGDVLQAVVELAGR